MGVPTPRAVQRTYLVLTAREHARGVAHLGDQHDLPARRGALEPGGVRRQRVLHGRDGAVRGADRDRRRHGRAARVVPARDGDAGAARRCSTSCCGRSRRRSGRGRSSSLLLGLGFTFFSGAVEAWLVDALTATGFTGELETVFARGQIVGGAAMLSGSVARRASSRSRRASACRSCSAPRCSR